MHAIRPAEFIAVDLERPEEGLSLHLGDIKLPKGVSAVTRGSQNNPTLVAVVPPAVEIEAPAADAAAAAPARARARARSNHPGLAASEAACPSQRPTCVGRWHFHLRIIASA